MVHNRTGHFIDGSLASEAIRQLYTTAERIGYRYLHTKQSSSISLVGTLELTDNGWLLLRVPSELIRGIWKALRHLGYKLPSKLPGPISRAGIVIMTPAEVAKIQQGGEDIGERGAAYTYRLGKISKDTWRHARHGQVSYFFWEVICPQLSQLRKRYGLDSYPYQWEQFRLILAVSRPMLIDKKAESSKHSQKVQLIDGSIVDLQLPDYLSVMESPIDGLGIVADKTFRPGELIHRDVCFVVPWPDSHLLLVEEDDVGRFINHSNSPNAVILCHNDNQVPGLRRCDLVAKEKISEGDEITIDYYSLHQPESIGGDFLVSWRGQPVVAQGQSRLLEKTSDIILKTYHENLLDRSLIHFLEKTLPVMLLIKKAVSASSVPVHAMTKVAFSGFMDMLGNASSAANAAIQQMAPILFYWYIWPYLRGYAHQLGYTLPPPGPGVVADRIMNMMNMMHSYRAFMQSANQMHDETKRTVAGFLRMMGVNVDHPAAAPMINQLTNTVLGITQNLSFFFPGLAEYVYGPRSVPALMARHVAMTTGNIANPVTGFPYYASPQDQRIADASKILWEHIYGPHGDLRSSYGFSASQVSSMFPMLLQSGAIGSLAPGVRDPEQIANAVQSWLPALYAARTLWGQIYPILAAEQMMQQQYQARLATKGVAEDDKSQTQSNP